MRRLSGSQAALQAKFYSGSARRPAQTGLRLHDPRQSYASRALALSESLTMIGKLLAHTQVQTTARYAHLARDSIQNAAARITGSNGGNLSSVPDADKTTAH